MIRRPPRSTRTDTLFPYTTLFRSDCWALVFTPVLSRYSFVWLTHRQTTEDVLAGFEAAWAFFGGVFATVRSEEHTSELQSLMRISYAVFCLKKKKNKQQLLTTLKYQYRHHKCILTTDHTM